ncbi:uncharacterized protein RSE6_02032 [Rhynchosporium secalis]|uniref:Uncharacterized protein n=1 Tax=Rhynchosporium secalis TaxID=38038 RepID=A0A1E1LZ95_RHYSE|nr:uncharacterized protein RSE6_02032 [Rhynchosporium secalis]
MLLFIELEEESGFDIDVMYQCTMYYTDRIGSHTMSDRVFRERSACGYVTVMTFFTRATHLNVAATYLPTYLPTYLHTLFFGIPVPKCMQIEVHLNPVLSSLLSSRINIEKCSIGGGCSFLAFTLQRSLGSRPGQTCLQRLDDLIGPGCSWAWSGSCSAIKLSARPSVDSDSDCDSFRSRPSPLSVKSRHYDHKCRINPPTVLYCMHTYLAGGPLLGEADQLCLLR